MTFQPSEHIKTILKNLPMKPGVYLMKDEHGKIIYVGKAKKPAQPRPQLFQFERRE